MRPLAISASSHRGWTGSSGPVYQGVVTASSRARHGHVTHCCGGVCEVRAAPSLVARLGGSPPAERGRSSGQAVATPSRFPLAAWPAP